jgi:hypothetical protein
MNLRRNSMIGILAAVCALSASLYVPGAAVAATPQNPVLADCGAHPGGLVGNYSVQQLRHALQIMPPETREYTSCPDVVNRALLAALGKPTSGGSSSGGGGSGSFLPTPVIFVLVVLALAAITFGALAIRRQQAGGAAPGDGPEAVRGPSDDGGHRAVADEPREAAGESQDAGDLGD